MAAVEDSWMLGRAFVADFERDNVTVAYRTVADRLVVDNGRVSGVLAHAADGGQVALTARRGVVLATGGYQSNPRLRLRYQPEFVARAPYLGVDTCRGDGHLMGQAVGGDLINMTQISPLVIAGSAFLEEAVGIGRDGRR